MSKLNPGVLRGIDGGTYHFITIPRSGDQEFIDHVSQFSLDTGDITVTEVVLWFYHGFFVPSRQSMIPSDYMAAQIQNSLVVDIIQSQPPDQQDSLDSHDIYGSDAAVIGDRHYTLQQHNSNSLVLNQNQISSNAAALHRSDSMSDGNANFAEDTSDAVATVIMNEQERRMTDAFMHYVQKQSPHLLTNEAPVIVATPKDLTAMASPLNDIDMEDNFVTSMTHMDQSPFSPMEKCMNLSSNQNHAASKSQSNSLPPLPPLTPISKLQTARRTRDLPSQQQIIQYKHVAEDHRLHAQADIIDAKYGKIHSEDVGPLAHTMKLGRQSSNETANAQAPRKSLPHKKRITKKLKNICPSEEQLQIQLQQAHYESQLHPYHHSLQQQQHHPTDAMGLTTPHQHSLQSSQSSQNIQHVTPTTETAIDRQSLCRNQLQAENMSMGMASSVITQHHSSPFACELCGIQTDSQLEFFNHLKMHYEPSHPSESMKTESQKPETDDNGLDLSGIDLPTAMSTFSAIHQNSQNIYEMAIPSSREHFSSAVEASMCAVNECRNDEDSIGAYNDHSHQNHIKSEQNHQFSDTEDMLESGVVDKVQRTVDNYIKNSTAAAKGSEKNDWFEQHVASDLSNHIVYHMSKSNTSDGECGLDANAFHMNRESNGNTVNERIPATATSEELTLIYEINGKDLTELIDDSTSDTILRNQLIKATAQTNGDDCEYDGASGGDSNGINYVIEKDKTPIETGDSLTMQNIFDEFIEQEETDSESEATATKANGTRKKKKIYHCKRCDKLCYSKNALHYHFLSHTGERPFVCEICGKSFFAGSALKVHKRLHSGDKPYECSFCNRPFRQWGDLKYHIQSRHTTEKNHQCEFCGKDFARRYSLVIHRRIHTGEKNYQCDYCDKQFRASSYLQVHRKIHTGEKPYVCDICGKKFRVRGDLKRHSNIHERDKSKEVKSAESLEGVTSTNSMTDGTILTLGIPLNCTDHAGVILNAAAENAPKDTGKKSKKRITTKANKTSKSISNANLDQMAIDYSNS